MADAQPPERGSMTDIAAVLGVTPQAVSKHKLNGLITPGPDGKYDVGQAVELIRMNRDPKALAEVGAGSANDTANLNSHPLLKARTFSATIDAKRRQIELERLQGSLISKADARAACLAVAMEIKNRLDGLPATAAPLAHSAATVAEAEVAIRAVLRACLVEVAKLGEALAA